MRDCFFSPTVPLPMFTNMDRMVKQLRERFSPRALCCCRGELSPHRASFWLKMYGALLFSGRTFKKIITRVINATLAVRLLMFLFYVCFCTQRPLASSVYVRVRTFARTDRVFIMPSVSICQVSGYTIFSRYESIRHRNFAMHFALPWTEM